MRAIILFIGLSVYVSTPTAAQFSVYATPISKQISFKVQPRGIVLQSSLRLRPAIGCEYTFSDHGSVAFSSMRYKGQYNFVQGDEGSLVTTEEAYEFRLGYYRQVAQSERIYLSLGLESRYQRSRFVTRQNELFQPSQIFKSRRTIVGYSIPFRIEVKVVHNFSVRYQLGLARISDLGLKETRWSLDLMDNVVLLYRWD